MVIQNLNNSQFAKFGLASIMSLVSAIAIPQMTYAQTAPEASTSEVADDDLGNLANYSAATAPLLYRGQTGEAVADVQAFLKERGFYNGTVDGVHGDEMISSVITFQRSRNLFPDGLVGERTWEALIDAYNRTSPAIGEDAITAYQPETAPLLTYGERGPAVEVVQAFLRDNGYYNGAIDGVYGSSTLNAVRAFQSTYTGIQRDGIVGTQTWDAMIRAAEARG